MKHLDLAKRNREIDPTSWDKLYNNSVVEMIRAKYSANDELAILRQRDTKPEEFAEYYEYVESCKEKARAAMEETS